MPLTVASYNFLTAGDNSGVALENVAAQSGGPWIKVNGGMVVTSAHRVRANASASWYVLTTVVSGNDMTVDVYLNAVGGSVAGEFKGAILQSDSAAKTGYLVFWGGSSWVLGFENAGSFSNLGTFGSSPTPSGALTLEARMVDKGVISGNITYGFTCWVNGTQVGSEITHAGAGVVLPITGRGGIYGDPTNTDSTGIQFERVDVIDPNSSASATTYTLSLSPSPGTAGSAVTATVTPNGGYTGTITLTPSGCGLSSAQTLTFSASATPQSVTFTPATSGTLTVTGTNGGGLTNPSPATDTINAAPVTVLVNDSNLYFNKCWHLSGTNWAQTTNPHAEVNLTASGTGSISMNLDPSGISGTNGMTIEYSVDNAAWQPVTLTTNSTSLSLGSGSNAVVRGILNVETADCWSTPSNPWKVTSFTIAAGLSTVATTRRPKKVLVMGDSITRAAGDVYDGTGSDWHTRYSYSHLLAAGLDADPSNFGISAQGWSTGGITGSNFPAFYTIGNDAASSWNKVYAGTSIDFTGVDYLIVNEGQNGSPPASNKVSSFLTDARTACGSSTWIIIMIPFSGNNRSAILTSFNNYASGSTSTAYGTATVYTATGDSKALLIDLNIDSWFVATGSASDYSGDKVHPNRWAHALIASRLTDLIRRATTPATGGGGTTVKSPLRSYLIGAD